MKVWRRRSRTYTWELLVIVLVLLGSLAAAVYNTLQ